MFSKLGFTTEILSLRDLMFSFPKIAAPRVHPPEPVHHLSQHPSLLGIS